MKYFKILLFTFTFLLSGLNSSLAATAVCAGGIARLNYSSSGLSPSQRCDDPAVPFGWNPLPAPAINTSSFWSVPVPAGTAPGNYNFSLTCGGITSTDVLPVIACSGPNVSVSRSPLGGGLVGDTASITWSATGATSLTLGCTGANPSAAAPIAMSGSFSAVYTAAMVGVTDCSWIATNAVGTTFTFHDIYEVGASACNAGYYLYSPNNCFPDGSCATSYGTDFSIGSTQYWLCNAVVNCTAPWGATIAHNTSIGAYQTATVPFGSSCASVWENRSCFSTVLSGSYTNQYCTVLPVPTCANGATNPPTCTTCPVGKYLLGANCVVVVGNGSIGVALTGLAAPRVTATCPAGTSGTITRSPVFSPAPAWASGIGVGSVSGNDAA